MFGIKKKDKFLWRTPTGKILDDINENTTEKVITGECLATIITNMGIECKFVNLISAPQVITYKFNLVNVMDISKIKK